MAINIKVIAFDLDGVLYDGPSAVFPVAHALGLGEKFIAIMKENQTKRLTLEQSIIKGSKIWEGIPVDGTLNPIVESIPLMEGSVETIHELKERGYIVGCISSGVSQFFLEPFQRRLGLDFAYSNVLGELDGKHDGKVHYVMGGPQKAQKAKEVLEERGLSQENLACIGDGENDIELFRFAKFSIAFNPENDRVSEAASVTVRSKNLRDVLQYFS
ncbi:MAG: HAD-IB family phosphatase [Candidatus Lokiarchaeota archaeon]|nr:HAD-IB family phosphatase [Candidatus Lokiarchaeota archaeon]